jgi:porin
MRIKWARCSLALLMTFSMAAIWAEPASENQKQSAKKEIHAQGLAYHGSHPLYHIQKITKGKQKVNYRPSYHLGVEEAMETNGLSFSGNYVADLATNPIGGKSKGFKYAGSLGMFFNLDLERIFHWTGWDFYFSATWRKGSSLSKDKIGNVFDVMQVYGSETLKLSGAAFKYTGLDGDLIWYLGRIGAGDIFLTSPYYSYYVNNGIDGNPVAIFFNLPFTAYPNVVWGSALDVKNDYLELKLGVFDTNVNTVKSKYHGLNFTFHSPYGALLIAEGSFLIGQSKKDMHGWPGNYKIGVAYITGQHNEISGKKSRADINYYLLFDQVFFQRDHKQFGAFFSLIMAEPDKNTFPLFMNGGINLKGLFPSRNDDVSCFGFVYGDFSKDIRTINKLDNQPLQHAETVLELNHMFDFSKYHGSVQPCIQYVIHPNGQYNIPNALVLAMQITFVY